MSEYLSEHEQPSVPIGRPIDVPQMLPLEQAPPGDPQSAHQQPEQSIDARSFLARVTWLMLLVVVLLAIKYLMPAIVEQYHYAASRGRLRGEYEMAKDALNSVSLERLSLVSEMVAQRIAPSVVHIAIETSGTNDRLAEAFPGLDPDAPGRRYGEGQGSGVIVDPDGYVVTNYHVVEGADQIQVTLSDGRRVRATIVGVDELTDLAVLRIPATGLIAAEWGDSDQLRVGSLVWAVGSPFGLDHSITSGIISAKNRFAKAGTPYQNFLQTDAAVNPGNSGGPLVDAHGRVVGINTAIVGHVYQGVSFAIPSSVAREVYERIRREGRVTRGWLGIAMEELDSEQAAALGVPDGKGVLVSSVVPDGPSPTPARVAGIQEGDVVVAWNGKPIENRAMLSRAVADTPVGSTATIEVIRDGQRLQLEVVVGERPQLRR